MNERLQQLNAFMQKQGFIWGPAPEIYGGLAGFYTYGPLGKLLKTNVENRIRNVFLKNQFFEVECPTVMPKKIWEASGHLNNFSDPLIKSKTGGVFRVDRLIEEFDPTIATDGLSNDELLQIIQDKEIKSPVDKSDFEMEIKQHDLMMKTTVGMDLESYNRPETATTTYLPFPRYLEFFRDRLPFGVFQIGKAYRNEISPRMHVMRGREFTQAEGQLFLFPDQKQDYPAFDEIKDVQITIIPEALQTKEGHTSETCSFTQILEKGYMKTQSYAWAIALAYDLFISMGIPKDRIRFRQHGKDEKAFYADDAWDLEVKTETFGWTEMCGIHDRTDYDLTQHATYSGVELKARDNANEKVTPHIVEIAFGVDRAVFSLLDISYAERDKEEGKSTLHLPQNIAPVQCAIYPLMKKDPLVAKAKALFKETIDEMVCIYDASGSIGKRYLRASVQGIPYCITVDFDTLEDGMVTIRDRDTEEQKRISFETVPETVKKLTAGKLSFDSL